MTTRKSKKQTSRTKRDRKIANKKKLGLILIYLKALKIAKIVFYLFIIFFTIYIVTTFHKNKTITKIKNNVISINSKIFYQNICSNIEINGLERANIDKIRGKIYNFCNSKNKNNIQELLNKINEDPWIKNVTITRKIPNTLKIKIEEYLPFAIWKNKERTYLIDENGVIVKIDNKEKRAYYNLLIVGGEESKENIYSLFNLLSSNPALFSRVKSALRIGKRRWNLELDNKIIIKMPENNVLEAWSKLNKILSIRGSEIDLKVIDLRNEDRIFLEEKEK